WWADVALHSCLPPSPTRRAVASLPHLLPYALWPTSCVPGWDVLLRSAHRPRRIRRGHPERTPHPLLEVIPLPPTPKHRDHHLHRRQVTAVCDDHRLPTIVA